MIAAIDLNELAHAITAPTGLLNAITTPRMRHPQPVLRHPGAKRFLGHAEPVTLDKLLSRERRSKVRVAASHQQQGRIFELFGELTITRLATLPRDKPLGSGRAVPSTQTFDLAQTEPKHPRRSLLG